MLHLRTGLPPAVIFHGTLDRAVPFATVAHFAEQYAANGNTIILHKYEGKPHAFYHIHKDAAIFKDHCLKADRFLQQLGILEGQESPALADEIIATWRQSTVSK
jgi:acetyl esterase/lipase